MKKVNAKMMTINGMKGIAVFGDGDLKSVTKAELREAMEEALRESETFRDENEMAQFIGDMMAKNQTSGLCPCCVHDNDYNDDDDDDDEYEDYEAYPWSDYDDDDDYNDARAPQPEPEKAYNNGSYEASYDNEEKIKDLKKEIEKLQNKVDEAKKKDASSRLKDIMKQVIDDLDI